MKMKSLKTQFIGAIAMVLVAAIAMGSSTYAWFSMNSTATATDMSVTVKSDSTFLLIKEGQTTASEVQTAKKTEASAITASGALYPVAHNVISAVGDVTAETDLDSDSTPDVKANWFYKYSDDPTVYGGDGHESAATQIPIAKFNDYVLVNTFTLTLAQGSNAMSGITVQSCSVTETNSGAEAVKVLVVGTDGWREYNADGTLVNNSSATLRSANLTDSTVEVVKVYIYWDGADSDVFTNNISNLKQTNVEVVFSGSIVNS